MVLSVEPDNTYSPSGVAQTFVTEPKIVISIICYSELEKYNQVGLKIEIYSTAVVAKTT